MSNDDETKPKDNVIRISRQGPNGKPFKNVSPIKPEMHEEIINMRIVQKTYAQIKEHIETKYGIKTSVPSLCELVKKLDKESKEVAATVIADKIRKTIKSDFGVLELSLESLVKMMAKNEEKNPQLFIRAQDQVLKTLKLKFDLLGKEREKTDSPEQTNQEAERVQNELLEELKRIRKQG